MTITEPAFKYKIGDVLKIKYSSSTEINGLLGRIIKTPNIWEFRYHIKGSNFMSAVSLLELEIPTDSELMQFLLEEKA